jgi:putative transposase
MIETLKTDFPVNQICHVLGVSRSGYYRYARGATYRPKPDREVLAGQVKVIFTDHKRRYGKRRIAQSLKDTGIRVGARRVARLMREQKLKAIQPKRFTPRTTQSRHGKRHSPNLLLDSAGKRLVVPNAPNQVWISDITYLPLEGGGFGYLAMWIDLFSRYVVGWQVAEHMQDSLVIDALKRGLQTRRPSAGLILHSDRGGSMYRATCESCSQRSSVGKA